MATNMTIQVSGLPLVAFVVASGDVGPTRRARSRIELLDAPGVFGTRAREVNRTHEPLMLQCIASASSFAEANTTADNIEQISGKLARVSIIIGGQTINHDAVVEIEGKVAVNFSPLITDNASFPAFVSVSIIVRPLRDA